MIASSMDPPATPADAARRSGARKAERVASGAIEWGEPILPSGLSTVADGRLWYRGEDAVRLAKTQTLEDIARLLWRADSDLFAHPVARANRRARPSGEWSSTTFLSRVFIALARRAGADPPSYGRAPPVLRSEAASVFATLIDSALEVGGGATLHERLALAWRSRAAADVLRRALVLLADHELNASTFATRVTVSTGASLASGVLAGLASLSGPLHGRAAVGVFEMVRAAERASAAAAVRDWLEQDRPLSGFGHPLYPEGDVRAQALLAEFEVPAPFQALRTAAEDLAGERPNVDFALAALTQAFRLPEDAPLMIFALARSVGWLAHALEQASDGHLIRPRARYVGVPVHGVLGAEPGPRASDRK